MHREEEEETMMWPQATECWATRASAGRGTALRHRDFKHLTFRTVGEFVFFVLSY